MTDELQSNSNSLEDMLIEHHLCSVIALGFNNSDEMENFKYNAYEGMLKFGGSFLQGLGHALAAADTINSTKIIKHFRKECDEHANLYIKFLEKNK